MDETDVPGGGPGRETLEGAFHVTEVRREGDRILYFGEPLVPQKALMERVWPAFRKSGYEVQFTTADRLDVEVPGRGNEEAVANGGTGPGAPGWTTPTSPRQNFVLVAEPVSIGVDGIPWTNVALLVATILSTLYAGSLWYHIDLAENPAGIVEAWPFTVAIMGVLGVHELGHYVMSRYHGVNATLPYFIPVPTLIGTMGAVIKMKGRMPDRDALFDIGVAGPLAGLIATIAVTAIGLLLGPIPVPEAVQNSEQAVQIHLGFPPLMYGIAWAVGKPLSYGQGMAVNPVVIGGWVGMFVTFLNLLPVGQLDGGHILRAMAGEHQERIAALVPAVLFALAGYLYFFGSVAGNAVFIWVVWGVFAGVFAFVGPASPVRDQSLDRNRMAIGITTFVLGVLCFTPVPIAISG
jgi:membrane-associated protease RseP (regulator of RpoE activity)